MEQISIKNSVLPYKILIYRTEFRKVQTDVASFFWFSIAFTVFEYKSSMTCLVDYPSENHIGVYKTNCLSSGSCLNSNV